VHGNELVLWARRAQLGQALPFSQSRIEQAERLDENLGALNVELAPSDLEAIESASAKIKLEGARYPAFHEKLVGR
jgi:diketogulonate reductase-like aldo/keto reductase